MLEIQATSVQIKMSDGNEDKYVLVHDGKQVIALADPGCRVATNTANKMLVGTKEELEAEVQRLALQPAKPPPGKPPVEPAAEPVLEPA
jgi:hypothetical protein